MEIRVRVSDDERQAGALTPENAAAAAQIFHRHGCLVLENLYRLELLDRLFQGLSELYGHLSAEEMLERSRMPGHNPVLQVGERRFDIALALSAPFDDPALFSSPTLISVLRLFLDNFTMASFTCVVSYPGAAPQNVHRDYSHLYRDKTAATSLPTFAINVSVPLVDVDEAVGPTGFWFGSHRTTGPVIPAEMVPVTVARGDIVMIDYRLIHRGTANRTNRVRPILYMVYARPWFVDDRNHARRSPLEAPRDLYRRLDPDQQDLLSRAWIEQVRASDGKCPCGSGATFNVCHGAQ